jgi:ferredoxin-NADP reductase
MSVHKVKLLRRTEIAAGTMAFHLEKPSLFNFKAGQCMSVTLMNPPETDVEGNSRIFSIASAPFEQELMIATRMRDTAFKRVLKTMTFGTELEIDGPYGDFMLHKDQSQPAVFLTGGIGITPVLSMLRQAAHDKLRHSFILFFSNRTLEETPFFEELEQMKEKVANFTFVPTMTKLENSSMPWGGEKGYIAREMIAKYVADLSQPVYYVVGPPNMALAVKKMLEEIGINRGNIRFEDFSGY